MAVPQSARVVSAGKPVKLSLPAEEVATLYGKMLHLECTTKEVFQRNFFSDWRKVCVPAAPAAALDRSGGDALGWVPSQLPSLSPSQLSVATVLAQHVAGRGDLVLGPLMTASGSQSGRPEQSRGRFLPRENKHTVWR